MLPTEAPLWAHLEQSIQGLVRAYGYQQIRTPIVEQTALFKRGIGEVTDIVEKEMYSFEDSLNGEQLTLRPEGTAAAVRAVIEHNLLYEGPKRLWYTGPMFRHERPQRGRYRQFHQLGIEALGFAGPDIDAEIILMCQRLWDDLGLFGIKLELNSLGQAHERAAHREALIEHFKKHEAELDEDAKRRLHTNPLRILDSKNPAMKPIVESAPQLLSYLGEESLKHFEGVQKLHYVPPKRKATAFEQEVVAQLIELYSRVKRLEDVKHAWLEVSYKDKGKVRKVVWEHKGEKKL